MVLSKKQKEERTHHLVVIGGVTIILGLLYAYLINNPKPEPSKVDSNTTTLMNSDSLEIANPDYLEKYFETWE